VGALTAFENTVVDLLVLRSEYLRVDPVELDKHRRHQSQSILGDFDHLPLDLRKRLISGKATDQSSQINVSSFIPSRVLVLGTSTPSLLFSSPGSK